MIVRHLGRPTIQVLLRNENDQEGNTWFSTATDKPDIQLTCDREVWVALGSPEKIVVTVEPAGG